MPASGRTSRTLVAVRERRRHGVVQEDSVGFERITVNPEQMGGVPCIRSLRIPVATVVGLVTQGMAETEILAEFPDLEVEDIRRALAFAAAAVDERQLPVLTGT